MTKLTKYKQKRHFERTPEPKAVAPRKPRRKALRFVVHRHLATRDHYDFRLEVDGVLKSWAIPKGPTQNPAQKRLAVMVEDHPLDYKDFEGVIPKGNYGAGPVMIWDEGFYRPIGALASENLGQAFEAGLKKGHLVFGLAGQKLSGEFALIKLKKGAKNDWLLIKARDWYATSEDPPNKDKSARSGRTMAEIKQAARSMPRIRPQEPRTDFPHLLKPMLATLVEKPFDDKDWLFEIKWDGYRVVTEVENGCARLYSRNQKLLNEKFPEIAKSFLGFPRNAIFDGEVVVVNSAGQSHFQSLQDYPASKGSLIYYVFDLLYYDGYNLIKMPLYKRRELLKRILPEVENVQFSDELKGQGVNFYAAAKNKGLEGIIAKKADSRYLPGKRSRDWLKIKILMQQETVICGFTKPRGTRKGFGSLVLGVYKGGKLVHVGNVGTGFSQKSMTGLLKQMKSLVVKDSPLGTESVPPETTWIRPELVAEVKFQEWTKEGLMRQPVFLGLREDKQAKEVRWEV